MWKITLLSILLVGCAAPERQPASTTQSGEGFIDAGDWTARIDPAALRVEGTVTLSATNYAPELKFDSLSRSDPSELSLRLVINKTGDYGGQMISEKPVRYEDPKNLNVGTISILYPTGQRHTITQIDTAAR